MSEPLRARPPAGPSLASANLSAPHVELGPSPHGLTVPTAAAYAGVPTDAVRDSFERAVFARLVPRLLSRAGGGRLLDLGCGDGQVADLAGPALERYVGVDLDPPRSQLDPPRSQAGEWVTHDLRQGLGPVGREPYDLYLATFGFASHLAPSELRRLLRDIAHHARPGSLVALEGLGLHSLEWPRLWSTPPGSARMLPYRLAADVTVHPWGPDELSGLFEEAGIRPLLRRDRTLQAGPKLGENRYWPGLPAMRRGLAALMRGDRSGLDDLGAPLPPLPAHPAGIFHHALATRRAALVNSSGRRDPRRLARAVWALEPASSAGLGHGLLVVGRVGQRA